MRHKMKNTRYQKNNRNYSPHHLCFQIGSKYYLMNLMEGKVEEGTILGALMNRVNAEMKKDMQKQAGGVSR